MQPLFNGHIVSNFVRCTFLVCCFLVLLLGAVRAQDTSSIGSPPQTTELATTPSANSNVFSTQTAELKETTTSSTTTLTQSTLEPTSSSSTAPFSSSTKVLVPEETPIISSMPFVVGSSRIINPGQNDTPTGSIPKVRVPTRGSRSFSNIPAIPPATKKVQGSFSQTIPFPQPFPTPINLGAPSNPSIKLPPLPKFPNFIPAFPALPASFQIENPSLADSPFDNGFTRNEAELREGKKVENPVVETSNVEPPSTKSTDAIKPTDITTPAGTQSSLKPKIQAASQDDTANEPKNKEESAMNSISKTPIIAGTIAGCVLLFASGAGGIYYFYSKRSKDTEPLSRRKSSNRRPSEEEQIHIVYIPYIPELEDELKLSVGDQVIIQERFQDKWVLGTNLTTGDSGCFPILCLDEDAASSIPSEFGSVYSMDRNTMSEILSQRSYSLNLRNSGSIGRSSEAFERDTHLM